MCKVPPDVVPSHNSVGKGPRGDIDPAQWAVDQRPFVWAAPSKPADDKAPGSPLWTTGTHGFHPGTPLPQASGLETTGDETESSSTLGRSTPVLRKGKGKVWEPELNGGQATAPTLRSIFSSPLASGVEILQPNSEISFMPKVEEKLQLAEVPNYPTHVPESSGSKEEGSQRSPWVTRITHHKASNSRRPGAPKRGERVTPSKSVSVSQSLSDNEDLSEDDLSQDQEGSQVVSEKHRKRMLSNRASAQRSRRRRQERLDTLEVLVAELRVENVALARKAKNATAAAKSFDEENKILRERMGKQEALPLSDGNSCAASDETEYSAFDPTRIRRHNSYTQEASPFDRYPGESLGSSDRVDEPLEGLKQDPHQCWDNISRSSLRNIDVEVSSDPMNVDAAETLNRTPDIPYKTECQNLEVAMGMDLTALCKSEIMGQVHASLFQGLGHPFGADLEQSNQEMDRNLDARSVEDIWFNNVWPTS